MVQEKCALRYQEGDFPLLDVAKPIKVRIEPANNNAVWLCGFDKDDGTEIAYLVGCMTGPDFPGTKMAEFLARPDANLIAVHGDPDLAVETLSKLAEQDPDHPVLLTR